MTKQEAISELIRAAEICPTTPLAEACRMAVEALRCDGENPDCGNCHTCKHRDRMYGVYPCSMCVHGNKWEPKEV